MRAAALNDATVPSTAVPVLSATIPPVAVLVSFATVPPTAVPVPSASGRDDASLAPGAADAAADRAQKDVPAPPGSPAWRLEREQQGKYVPRSGRDNAPMERAAPSGHVRSHDALTADR